MNKSTKKYAFSLAGVLALFAVCFCVFAVINFTANQNDEKATTISDVITQANVVNEEHALPQASHEVYSGEFSKAAMESPIEYLAQALKVVTDEDQAKHEAANTDPYNINNNSEDLAYLWDASTATVQVGNASSHNDWTAFDSHYTAGWFNNYRYKIKTLEIVDNINPYTTKAWCGCLDIPEGGQVRTSNIKYVKGLNKIGFEHLTDTSFMFIGSEHLQITSETN